MFEAVEVGFHLRPVASVNEHHGSAYAKRKHPAQGERPQAKSNVAYPETNDSVQQQDTKGQQPFGIQGVR